MEKQVWIFFSRVAIEGTPLNGKGESSEDTFICHLILSHPAVCHVKNEELEKICSLVSGYCSLETEVSETNEGRDDQ